MNVRSEEIGHLKSDNLITADTLARILAEAQKLGDEKAIDVTEIVDRSIESMILGARE